MTAPDKNPQQDSRQPYIQHDVPEMSGPCSGYASVMQAHNIFAAVMILIRIGPRISVVSGAIKRLTPKNARPKSSVATTSRKIF
jgi:hypothetical protein